MARVVQPCVVLALMLYCCGAVAEENKIILNRTDLSTDPRLSKPVTVECVNVRLHDVTEELSLTTGVTIRCGKNEKDWVVRDVPVLVCARELPLGRLLRRSGSSTSV